MLKKLLFSNLKLLKHADLVIHDGNKKHVFGSKKEPLKAEIVVKDQAFFKYIIFGGSIGASEAYMNGYWSSPNLTNVIRVFAVNQQLTEKLETKFNFFIKPLFKLIHYLNKNSIKNSERNISAHYDLSNDFFKLFLDETMMYSSAIFKNKSQSLHHASLNKLDIICKKLQQSGTGKTFLKRKWTEKHKD
jgi:cyclopropane-fatty-acyl-phospholipid synthase